MATPISAPTTITEPGEYVLTGNLGAGQLKIKADDVILDGADYTMDGQLYCDYLSGGCERVIIKNFTGIGGGVKIWNSRDITVQNCTMKTLSVNGVNSGLSESVNVVIENCAIEPDDNLAGSAVVFGNSAAPAVNCVLRDSTVTGTGVGKNASTGGYGIQVSAPDDGRRSSVIFDGVVVTLTAPERNVMQVERSDCEILDCRFITTDPVGSGNRISLRSHSTGRMARTTVYMDAGEGGDFHGVAVLGGSEWSIEDCDIRVINNGGFVLFVQTDSTAIVDRTTLVSENGIVVRHYDGLIRLRQCVLYQADGSGNCVDLAFSTSGRLPRTPDLKGNLFIVNGDHAISTPAGYTFPIDMYGNHYWQLSAGALAELKGVEYADLAAMQAAGYDIHATEGAVEGFDYGADLTATFEPWPPRPATTAVKPSKPLDYEQGRRRRRRAG